MTNTENSIKAINSVAEFHDVFQIGNESTPTISEQKTYELRHRLMAEENDEYLEACKKGDLVEIADALGDQLYILAGTILKHGLQDKIQEVFDEIHRSNMSKLDEQGQPIFREDGKILKSNLYFRPNISQILNPPTLTLESILIAKNTCKMESIEDSEALILGKEYTINKIENDQIIVTTELFENHIFNLEGEDSWTVFFNLK